ncbi:hypothetical protein J2S74_005231 [Evansella vedderi]|uniref:Uncharacterized protein n=1 Tax=Evansella vedderi TaxID=38282 RepID=A0ABU0A3U4_9BACI|nr:hypothetical protein [Evansella vedderi]MDQ0257769.1 hypothetical protein [Evansella vedderi]
METTEKPTLVSDEKQTVVIPFGCTYVPLTKLALINFKKNADDKYIGFEPQYLDDKVIGQGYRVIAYRHDGYVDVYDDRNLNDNKDDSFDVTGKRLNLLAPIGSSTETPSYLPLFFFIINLTTLESTSRWERI